MLVARRKLIPFQEEERTRQRCIAITRKTDLNLSLDFCSGSDKPVPFDSIRVPVTRSVKHIIDPGDRQLLSLDIRLEDASSGKVLSACGGGGEEWVPFVDFRVDQNIIDLEQGKISLRVRLPCPCIDVPGRAFKYRCARLHS